MANTTPEDKVRELQRTLYRAAKADPKRRFHALYDKVHRRDVLERAWRQVRQNQGAAGVDGTTLKAVEDYGVERLLNELADELRNGRYRSLPSKRVWIPKPGTNEQRPLAIPAVRDRIVQAATKIVIEPIFEADFLPCSFGFRPKRSAHDALQVLIEEAWRGRRWVVETDIASCFEAIPKDGLVRCLEARISDQTTLKLLRGMLRAGVMEAGEVRHRATGTPQGGVISPLLANVYLHQLDRTWQNQDNGVLIRYADDLVVMCRDRAEAERALTQLGTELAKLGLQLKEAKTRIVHLAEDGEGFDFLGFYHRWVRARRARHVQFLARWPSRRAMQHARERIREATDRSRLERPITETVNEINRFLRGWTGYFRYGNSSAAFQAIRLYALDRVARLVAKRHKRRPQWGRRVVFTQTPNQMGVLSLRGIVVAPRPGRPWRQGI